MTEKRYLFEHELAGASRVTAVGEDERRHWVRLDRTWFHAQGGGQKADQGTISGAEVVHVAHAEDGEVNHYLSGPPPFATGDEVHLEVDAEVDRELAGAPSQSADATPHSDPFLWGLRRRLASSTSRG